MDMYGQAFQGLQPNNPFKPMNLVPQGPQLLRVKGLASAKMFQTQPNSMIPLFDEDDDILYVKQTDASNYPTIRTFKLVEVTEEENKVNTDQFVTKDELNSVLEKTISQLREEIQNGKQSIQEFAKSANTNNNSSNKYGKPNSASKSDG